MAKSADAFRTISEVADWLEVPAHVLRFWESKFTQVKPVKRAGGRRYYRPADMRLLAGIKLLLHDQGMTIKGVQKMLREEGVHHVSALAPNWGEDGTAVEETGAQVITFARATGAAEGPEPEAEPETPQDTEPEEAMTGDAFADTDDIRDAGPTATDAPPEAAQAAPEIKAAPEPDAQIQEVAALAPLPDLPDDPPDRPAADPGPLARLARLSRPIPTPLARRLAALADALRAHSERRQ